MTKEQPMIQVYDPYKKRWVRVNKKTGKVISRKTTKGAYINLPKSISIQHQLNMQGQFDTHKEKRIVKKTIKNKKVKK